MTHAEIARMVLSMEILIDTREQDTERFRRRIKAFECPVKRATLDFGDYTYNATFPDGTQLVDLSGRVVPKCSIERKMDLDELAQCFTHGRERFTAEFERATAHGADFWLLVENGNYDGVLRGMYRSHIQPSAFLGSILAFTMRYNAHVVFCSEFSTARIIRDILRMDLRERLERGEFMDGT